MLSVAAIGPALEINVYYGIAQAVASYPIVIAASWDAVGPSVHFKLVMSTLSLSGVALLVAVPFAVIPTVRSLVDTEPAVVKDVSELDIQFVKDSLSNIRDSLVVVSEAADLEGKKLDRSIQDLLSNLEKKNQEINTLSQEQRDLAREVDQYKALASLTEEQAKAVTDSLGRNKTLDNFIGFLLGLASSSIVYVVTRFAGSERGQARSMAT